jgi:hypothetical protein
LAIMGCGDDGAQCQQMRVEPVRYQSAAACQAAMAGALQRNTDLSFPVIQASCQKTGLTMASRDTSGRG